MPEYRRLDLGLLRAVLLTPNDPLPRALSADWFRERSDDEAADIIAAGRVPVDDLTGEACIRLNRVTMLPGSWEKRFTRDVASPIAEWWRRQAIPSERIRASTFAVICVAVDDRLTPKQYLWVWRLLRRYRRQWSPKKSALLTRAESILAMPVRG